MRPSLRLLNLEVSSLQGPKALHICSVCRNRPLGARQFLRNASNNMTPMTERVRRRLWGTDNPPGLKDPYGDSVLDKKFGRNQPQQEEPDEEQVPAAEQQEHAASEVTDAEYVPATTWEGLPRIGHLGKWSDYPPSERDVLESFLLKKKLTKKGHIALAAQQAAVEICILHSLNKPLTSICQVVEHDKAVYKLLWKCTINQKADGKWYKALVYPSKEAEDALIYIFKQIGGEAEANVEAAAEKVAEEPEAEADDVEEVEEQSPASLNRSTLPFFGYQNVKDTKFLSLSLRDPVTKFAFLKRFSQLSGHIIADPVVPRISSVQDAVRHIEALVAPKPKKLADYLVSNEGLKSMGNVKISTKKQKPWDRDEELGRRKIMEAELRARDLI